MIKKLKWGKTKNPGLLFLARVISSPSPNIHFAQIPGDDMPAYLAHCDLVVNRYTKQHIILLK